MAFCESRRKRINCTFWKKRRSGRKRNKKQKQKAVATKKKKKKKEVKEKKAASPSTPRLFSEVKSRQLSQLLRCIVVVKSGDLGILKFHVPSARRIPRGSLRRCDVHPCISSFFLVCVHLVLSETRRTVKPTPPNHDAQQDGVPIEVGLFRASPTFQ